MTPLLLASLVAAILATFLLRAGLRRAARAMTVRARPGVRGAIESLVAPLHALALAAVIHVVVAANGGDTAIAEWLTMLAAGFLALRVLNILVYDWYFGHLIGLKLPAAIRIFLNTIVISSITFIVLRFVFGIPTFDLGVVAFIIIVAGGLLFQGVSRDFIAGLSVWLQRGIQVGTGVRFHDYEGEVVAVDWKTTWLRVSDGGLLSIPNQMFVSSPVVRWAADNAVRTTVHFSTSASSSPNKVLDLARATAASQDDVLASPAPEALYEGQRDDAGQYRLHAWVANRNKRAEVESSLAAQLWFRLRREGHVADAGAESKVPVRSLLQNVPFLAIAGDGTVDQLADRSLIRQYGRGEVLFAQGEPGDSLHVIAKGRVAIRVDSGGRQLVVGHATVGDFVGEHSLLTGEPRTATVLAEEDTEVVVIGKDALLPALVAAPELAERISDVMTERDRSRSRSTASFEATLVHSTMLSRIRSFFGLRTSS